MLSRMTSASARRLFIRQKKWLSPSPLMLAGEAPSLLELTGAPALNKIDGRSWVSLVKDGDNEWRRSWFYYYNYEKQFPYTPNVRGMRALT